MRLNLFKSIVSFLVLFASGFIIAHADEEISYVGCRYLINCNEFDATFCNSLSFYVRKVEGSYQICPGCAITGTFGVFTPFCGTYNATYYGCGRPGPGLMYQRAEWSYGMGTNYYNYNCNEQCSCSTPSACTSCSSDSNCTTAYGCYTPYTWYCETSSY